MEELIKIQKAFIGEIASAKRNFDKTTAARRTRSYVEKRIEIINSCWEKFRIQDAKIRSSDDVDIDRYNQIYDQGDELYINFFGDLTNLIEEPNPPNPPIPPVQPQPSPYKLPQITLPVFSGDYSAWSAFYEMFNSLIHTNASLTNLQKLHQIKSSWSSC